MIRIIMNIAGMITWSGMALYFVCIGIMNPHIFIDAITFSCASFYGSYILSCHLDNLLYTEDQDLLDEPEPKINPDLQRGKIRSLTELKNEPNSSTFKKIPKQ